jgi:hypothetical protein
VVLRRRRNRPVPPKVWGAIANVVAGMHKITKRQLLYGGHDYRFSIPRARFWRLLRSLTKAGRPRYSLTAIADITGHDHTSVMHALKTGTADRDYSALMNDKFRRARRDLTGERFGHLTILGQAPALAPGVRRLRRWKFRCDCGTEGTATTSALAVKSVCGVHHLGMRPPQHVVRHTRQMELA